MKRVAIGSVLAGFAAGVVLFALFSFQPAGPFAAANVYWPPRPEWIVNWVAHEELGPSDIVLQAGEERVLMTVPGDRWFVLTYIQQEPSDLYLIERVAGVETVKLGSLFGQERPFLGATGITFRPGAEVVVRNMQPTYARTITPAMSLVGYYSR